MLKAVRGRCSNSGNAVLGSHRWAASLESGSTIRCVDERGNDIGRANRGVGAPKQVVEGNVELALPEERERERDVEILERCTDLGPQVGSGW